MGYEEGLKYKYDIFDVTKVWPEEDIPLVDIGKFTLNKMPEDFNETSEKSAHNPANLIDGIEASQDPLLKGRMFAYEDAARFRLGNNFKEIPTNKCPF